MENILEYGTDWNLYENLEAFKKGDQNKFKTAINIREIFKHEDENIRRNMDLSFSAEVERQHSMLKQKK